MEKLSHNSRSPEALLAWMESLADSTRLRLLRLLERRELGVVDVCAVLQLPQSTVSRHLKVLADQGWVRSERRGTTNVYHVRLDELAQPARKLWLVAREQTDGWATIEQDRLRLEQLLRDKEQDADSFFAGAAGEWDRLRAELYGTQFSTEAMLALLPGNQVVADLGCGTGTMIAQLAPHVKRAIGIDNNAAMLKAARRRAAGFDNVTLKRGDLADLPLEAATCDAALCILALTYVADPQACIGEMARILRPGGRVVIVDLLPHDRDDFRRQTGQKSRGFAPDVLRRWLTAVGMEGAAIRPLPPAPVAKGPALLIASAIRAAR